MFKFSKATCVSLWMKRDRDKAKQAVETKEKRETRLSNKGREASFV